MEIKKLSGRTFNLIHLTALSLLLLTGCHSLPSGYSIAMPLETDSILSAWLIKKHVNTQARFSLVNPPGQLAQASSASVPASKDLISVLYPPAAGATQFEQIVIAEQIQNDACVDTLKEASRVLEIMAWRKSQFPEVIALETQLKEAIPENSGNEDFNKAFAVINHWCEVQLAKQS